MKFITPLGEKEMEILANNLTYGGGEEEKSIKQNKTKITPPKKTNTMFWGLFMTARAKLRSKLFG